MDAFAAFWLFFMTPLILVITETMGWPLVPWLVGNLLFVCILFGVGSAMEERGAGGKAKGFVIGTTFAVGLVVVAALVIWWSGSRTHSGTDNNNPTQDCLEDRFGQPRC